MVDTAAQWLSRTLVIVALMVGPGILGRWLDRIGNTRLWMPVGFGLGMALGAVLMLVFAKRFTPVAKGRPLSDDELPSNQEGSERDSAADQRQVTDHRAEDDEI